MAAGGLKRVTGLEGQKVTQGEIAGEFGRLILDATALHQRRIANQHKEPERPFLAKRASVRGTLEKFGVAASELNGDDTRFGGVAKEQAVAIKLFTYRVITAALTRHIPIVDRAAVADKPLRAISVL